MISAEKSVYISYSWGAEKRHQLVDELLSALKAKDIEVKRDSNVINYGDSIRAYMDEIAAGRAIILVLSEDYFKSPNCMYELREIYLDNRKEFKKRIFPVVLKATKFHKTIDRIPYIRHWEEETDNLKAALDTVARENIGSVSHNELRDYADFRRIIDELLAMIGDMNHLTEEEHLKTGFAALIERMFSQPEPDGGGGTDKTDKAAKIGQHTIGNGNVTVNNFNMNAAGTPPLQKETPVQKAPVHLGTLFNVPDPPPNYFPRPDDLKEFRAALLAEGTQAVGITGKRQHVGVQGMGGLGKSVLAAALAHDEEVRAAFPDGIFWLRFRQDADDAYLLEQQAEILKILKSEQLPDTLAYGENLLNFALQDKRCLFIADDLWDSKHLRHFNVRSSGCRFLLTTRNAEVIKKIGAQPCELGLLDEKQAREFLALSSGCAENALPDEAAAILRECGRLPLAVAAIGSMVKGKPAQRWQMALEKLQNARLDKIPANLTDDYNYKSLFKVFEVSVDDLPPEVQAYYKTLIIFPEDAEIPESVLQLYWEHCPQGDYEPLDAVDLLVERSLLSRNKDEFVTLHDLLRDYLRHQSGGDVANLHKQLLEAYKAKYPGGWHTIPVEEPFYFHRHWSFHATIVGDTNLSTAIADALIQQQPMISLAEVRLLLKITGRQLLDVAPLLLKINKNHLVLLTCLKTVGIYQKQDVYLLLKEDLHPDVTALCLKILGDEAKEEAWYFLKGSQHPHVIAACLDILGDEAKEDARRFLQEGQHPTVLVTCLNILGVEAKDDARRLLKESNQSDILIACLNLLYYEAKEDARRFLREGQHPHVLTVCLNILRWETKEDARRLLIESHDADVVATCINLLGDEVKETARKMLKENHRPEVLSKCLNMLGEEAKEDARRLIKESKYNNVLTVCLKILGTEAKEEAKILLKDNKHPTVLVSCLNILGDEAKKDARRLLKSAKDEWLIIACIRILGKEAKADAERLIKTSKNRFVREACQELLFSWKDTIGSRFPELARLKKNDAEE